MECAEPGSMSSFPDPSSVWQARAEQAYVAPAPHSSGLPQKTPHRDFSNPEHGPSLPAGAQRLCCPGSSTRAHWAPVLRMMRAAPPPGWPAAVQGGQAATLQHALEIWVAPQLLLHLLQERLHPRREPLGPCRQRAAWAGRALCCTWPRGRAWAAGGYAAHSATSAPS